MVMQVASAGNFSYGVEPAFSRGFAFGHRAEVDLDGGLAARVLRVRLVIALAALGLLVSAIFPLAPIHGGPLLGAGLGLISLLALNQAFDSLHRLKLRAAEADDSWRPATTFDRRPLHSLRHGAR